MAVTHAVRRFMTVATVAGAIAHGVVETASPGPLHARQLVSGHPWPMAQHDAQRTGRANVNGPRRASLRQRVPVDAGVDGRAGAPVITAEGDLFFSGYWCIQELAGSCFVDAGGAVTPEPPGTLRLFALLQHAYGDALLLDNGSLVLGSVALAADGARLWRHEDFARPVTGMDGSIYGGARAWNAIHRADPVSGSNLERGILVDYMLSGSVTLAPDDAAMYAVVREDADGGFDEGINPRLMALRFPSSGNRMQIIWEVPLADDSQVEPVVAPDGTIYVAAGPRVYAVAPDGTLKWTHAVGDISLSFTRLSLGPDGTIHLRSAHRVIALHPDGRAKWQVPAWHTNRVTIADAEGVVYFTDRLGVGAIGSAGRLLWRHIAFDIPYDAGLALGADGTLFVVSRTAVYSLQR